MVRKRSMKKQEKKCRRCGKIMDINLYGTSVWNCQECFKIISEEREINNRERSKRISKELYSSNRDILSYRKKRQDYFKFYFTENKNKFKQFLKNDYEKNKYKWKCRNMTLKIYKNMNIPLVCSFENCSETNFVEIHHEIYPTHKELILRAVEEHQIYPLCIKHHGFIHRKNDN